MDNKKEIKAEATPETAEKKPLNQKEIDEIVLAHRRRTALVMYLLVLFAVALIFVVISMISQNSKMKQLEDWGDSAVDRVQKLVAENDSLKQRQTELEAETASLQTQLAERDASLAQLETQAAQLADEKAALADELEALRGDKEDAEAAYELLLQAVQAQADGDNEALAAALKALAPVRDKLSEQGQSLYQSLLEALPQED